MTLLNRTDKESIERYLTELQTLVAKRTEIEERIQRLEAATRGILSLTDDENELLAYRARVDAIVGPAGFTDAIRRVLRSSKEALTPAEVKEKLGSIGFSLTGYSNPSASVHTTLKRLANSPDVKPVPKAGGTAYKWDTGRDARLAGVDVSRVGRKR
jgi:hypothetical protein